MNDMIMMGLAIVLTFAGIGVCIVLIALGLTLIKKKWPDVWN